ncbi:hypothetical protein [Nonomuraea insulae]|uniref:Thiazole-containing bacteriocin maturation protein n=1 Tax=Nonomuraea insulae TaxID=1616787 RepID=A0ABW1CKU3_9ACTN
MRPRLLDDVHFVESSDGVYVYGDLGACTIEGPHAYMWMSRLAPLLTGERALDEIVAPLTADRRELVERLVRGLAEQRLVSDAREEEPHTLSAAEREVYAPEIAFLRYGHDSAERRFERLRQARVVLVGDGPVLGALLEAGLRSGWRDVRVAEGGAARVDLAAPQVRGRRDDAQTVRPGGDWGDADVLLQVHDGEDVGELLRVDRACVRRGIACGQVWVRCEEAWLTPVSAHESESGWRRLSAPAYQESGEDGAWLTGAVPAVLAAQLALSCFEYLTGTGQPVKWPEMSRVDLRTLETRQHVYVRVKKGFQPVATGRRGSAGTGRRVGADSIRAEMERLAGLGTKAAKDLLKAAVHYVDPRTGVLGSLDEEGLAQIPLAVCRALVARSAVVGWGDDRETARLRALLTALAVHQWIAASHCDAWQGVEYRTGRLRSVTACNRPAVGVAAGLSWSQAVAAGLAQQCEALLARVDPTCFPVVEADLTSLASTGERTEARDLTGVLGLPAYAVLCGGEVRLACGTTSDGAMRRAVERSLLAWQSRTERQRIYADPPARWPDGDLDAEGLADVLVAAGRTPVVVPLGADAEVSRLLPFIAWVACCDE